MGKKHNADENAGRRGRANNTPGRSGDGFRKFFDKPAGEKPGKDRARGGEGSRGSEYPSRPTFGRTGGKPSSGSGFPNRFEDRGGSSRGNDERRPTERGGYGSRNSFGSRDNNRTERPNNRFSDRREERPARPYEPKATWPGQPYQQEGKPTVPRGTAGERNRKFNKANPHENKPAAPAPRAEEFKRPESTGPDREIRPARPFDYRGAPENFGNSNNRGARPEGGFGQRSTGERGLGNRGFGSDRRDVANRREDSRRDDRGDAPRTFREIREAARAGEKRFGRDAGSNQAGKPKRGEVAGQAPDYKNLRHYEEDKNRGNKRRRNEDDFGNETMRLNRYIANAGICSRREADALIAAGEIRVNGEVVKEMGYQVQPSDTVQYGKTNLKREKLVYVLLNKPKDFITTTDDPEGRRTVMDLVAGASTERLFPVGRLDRNTTGLLLFTNDGEVAQKLSHPSHKNKKIYQVELSKPLTEEHLRQIADGVELEDGKAEVDDVAVVAGNAHFVGIELHIGRNRIVRRIFEHLGYEVVALDRVQYAGLTKKDLPRGKWRFLNEKEVIRLKYFM
ncbi:pseudouridine synthase [Hymenobacter sp. GOD-10R]|uniref:pseudouridine synthase n=1 Tax=Hymenobacter sp. GOD-10R TaxID=3093922 RepID=UPI002D76AF23|nr:pseudouridine synthase [Hymenobacter sp. GOD-10R]WRQ28576.1 pseudouridine synthase [Hymenobacter sp. GOD-10R]